jgi:hypothetical protein
MIDSAKYLATILSLMAEGRRLEQQARERGQSAFNVGDQLQHQIGNVQQSASAEFARRNSWRHDCRSFAPWRIGKAHGDWELIDQSSRWLDHPLYFRERRSDGKRGFVNAALVTQPYHADDDTLEAIAAEHGLEWHRPPAGPYASIHFPGSTLFLVLTRPGRTIRWLDEQETDTVIGSAAQ